MMNKSRLQEILLIVLPVLAIIITATLYSRMPNQIPANYALSGEVSKYTEKSFIVFLIPVLSLFYYLYFLIIPKIDLHKENYQVFRNAYNILRLAGGVFLFVANIVYLASIFHPNKSEWVIALKVFIAITLLFFGDRLPKIKRNHFLGVVNPWTLRSKVVWYKTQRFTGKFVVGIACMLLILSFFNYEWINAIYFSLLLVMIIMPHIYSVNKYFVKNKEISGGN